MGTASFLKGTISTVAGTGEPGYSGDGGPAALATLNEPKSLAVGPDGSLYLADAENHVVRKVDPSGVITTVAGRCEQSEPVHVRPDSPSNSSDEDPFDPAPSAAGSYVNVSDLSGTVRFVVGAAGTRFGGDGGPAVQALLHFPSAVAVDEDGHLYIADTMNHRIRKVEARTGRLSTIAGNGQRRFSGDGGPGTGAALHEPAALAIAQGCLYIADQSNNRVRRLDLRTGVMATVAGTGEAAYTGDGMPAAEAALAGPSGLAIGPAGELYIADTFNARIRVVDANTGLIATIAGDGTDYRYQGMDGEFSTSLSRPYGIAVDAQGNLLITDSDSHLIRRWDREKKIITRLAGCGTAGYAGDGGAPGESALNYPFGVAVDRPGLIYIADTFNHRIRMIAA